MYGMTRRRVKLTNFIPSLILSFDPFSFSRSELWRINKYMVFKREEGRGWELAKEVHSDITQATIQIVSQQPVVFFVCAANGAGLGESSDTSCLFQFGK